MINFAITECRGMKCFSLSLLYSVESRELEIVFAKTILGETCFGILFYLDFIALFAGTC